MTRAELAREQTDRLLDRVLRVFDKAVLKIPPERLDFRPMPDSMTARQLAHHVYEVVLIYYRGAELGLVARGDLEFLALDPDAAETAHDLVVWGSRVKDYARRVAAELTEEQLECPVQLYLGSTATGWEALRSAQEEALHHRGQMFLYLRLMGIAPPRVNDYS